MRDLGELEAEVMRRIWDWQRPCTVREVVEDLASTRRLAYTTVMTVLGNLYKKGFVSREVVGRTYYYESLKSREEHTADLIAVALERSADRTAGLLRFVERLDSAELASLRRSLEQMPTRTRPVWRER